MSCARLSDGSQAEVVCGMGPRIKFGMLEQCIGEVGSRLECGVGKRIRGCTWKRENQVGLLIPLSFQYILFDNRTLL